MFRFAKMASGTVLLGAVLMAAGWVSSSTSAAASGTSTVAVVAGENQYGNVASQVGGKYVRVYSVDSNPNVDPHTYEATPSVGQKIAQANLLIENGVGYDSFMGSLASASPNSARKVINVQHLLGLPDSTENPHLWYNPKTMPAVAKALATDLSALDPVHAGAGGADHQYVHSGRGQPFGENLRGNFRAAYDLGVIQGVCDQDLHRAVA